MSLSLTIGYPEGDLVIPGSPDPTLGHNAWVTRLTLPDRIWRRTYAPPSQFIGGQTLLSSVLEASALTALVSIKAPTSADLGEQIEHLEQVLTQFVYVITTQTDTRTQTWLGEPGDLTYGDYSVGTDRMAAVQVAISIPASPTE